MILAAGRGTRLGELGKAMPKVLVEVGGEPLLSRHLSYLEHQGVRRVVVNAHHLAEQVQEFLDGYDGPLDTRCLVEQELLGTAGGVRNALDSLGGEPFVVLYGDILLDESLSPLVELHDREHAAATLAVHPADDVEGKGVVGLGPGDRVTGFLEKPVSAVTRPAWINSGLYVLDPTFVANLPVGEPLDFGRDVLPAAVQCGERIYAHRLREAIIDLGTPEALAQGRRRVIG
jgi:NDP-sugar pyrophosphorylase family protein